MSLHEGQETNARDSVKGRRMIPSVIGWGKRWDRIKKQLIQNKVILNVFTLITKSNTISLS